MSSLRLPSRAPSGERVWRQPAALGVMVAIGLSTAYAAVRWPAYAIAGVAVLIVVAVLVRHLTFALALLVAGFYFNNYLDKGAGILTVDKAIGALAVAAWLLEWTLGRRDMAAVRQMWPIGGLIVWLIVSMTVVRNQSAAFQTVFRYLLFFVLFFLVIQTVRGDRRRGEVIATVAVAAAAVSGVIGLFAFFTHHVYRASGPILDPNDFGFLLATTVPLAVFRIRWSATRAGRILSVLAAAAIFACILATFSRTALLGLAVAGLWAILTRRLQIRWGLAALVALAAIAGLAYVVQPQIILNAFNQKAYVADTNATTRLYYWNIAVKEFASAPVTGVGPGNYQSRFQQFGQVTQQDLSTQTTHNAYFNILAELGLPGIALFLVYLFMCWKDLRLRFRGDARLDMLQTSLAAGFLVAVFGALFLTEQFYPPLWLLPALGISLAIGARGDEPAGEEAPAAQPILSE